MFVLSNLIVALSQILNMVLTLYLYVIIARAILSWVNPDPYNPIVQFLYKITEPVLEPIRKAIPMRQTGLDISVIVVIFVIYFLQGFLVPTLGEFAMNIR